MNQNYNDVRSTAQRLLNRQLQDSSRSLSPDEILQAVRRAMLFLGCGEDEVDVERLVANLEASFQTIIGAERVLRGADDDGYEPWLLKRKADIDWAFWSRYEQHKLEEGWPQATLTKLDSTTDRILGLLTAPDRPGSWDRRGLVVGHVQSGKTSNYVGLICKAADAGYKLIVVLAGFHKSLRSQTQIRLEEGFLGYDRGAALLNPGAPLVRVGVGLLDPKPRADSITTRSDDGDFKRQVANNFGINPGGNPLLFVVKKNASVLKNLLNWVRFAANKKDEDGRSYVEGIPLLVIDDEADQGSIDTKAGAFDEDGQKDEDHDPSKLNKLIRRLLHLFDQSAYVGYTATPFANIFIHEGAGTRDTGEDLFPRSFIVSLPTPSNYVGPATVFGHEAESGEVTEGLPVIRHIEDHAASASLIERVGWMPPRHNKHHIPRCGSKNELPPSLEQAVRAFVLVCAARMARGQESSHNSMLVHVTRFTAVQNRVKDQIEQEVSSIKRRLRLGDGDSSSQLVEELRALWEEDFEETTIQVAGLGYRRDSVSQSWEDVVPWMERAALSVTVREINGAAGEVLDYVRHKDQGLNVIAVGGDKLSRGLTLEGLTVSYFLRASRMYDTLMQMGRWFGYRPGYVDLCRLYTTPDMTDWFSHIASASEELREDFNRMALSGGTPKDFGHRVKSHPLMLVTSRVKMRHGSELLLTFEGDISETINFWRTRAALKRNWQAAQRLVSEAEARGATAEQFRKSSSWTWARVDADLVLSFLNDYREHPASKKVKTSLLGDYVRKENTKERLTQWMVLVAGGQAERQGALGTKATFSLVDRSWHLTASTPEGKESECRNLVTEGHYRIRRLVDPQHEVADLDDDQIREALELTHARWAEDEPTKGPPTRPGGREIRLIRPPECGLLLLYPLDSTGNEKAEADATEFPTLGFAISFPHVDPQTASKVRYVVNNVYYEQEVMQPSWGTGD